MGKKAVLVDGNSLMYRAYHALPALDDGAGNPTGAVYGFFSMLLRVLADDRPDCAFVAFDVHGPTFRHERYAEYKGKRPPTPDDLRPQFPIAKEVLRAMGVAVLEMQRFEADDLIGTASRVCAEQGVEALIVTGDRDSFQLVGDGVCVLYTKRGISETERMDESAIFAKYGISPRQLIDMKALCGDTSDNIPGVPDIGEKTAAKLIAKYGDLNACLDGAETGEKGRVRERLLQYRQQAVECRFLAEIDRYAPVEIDISAAELSGLAGGVEALRKYRLNTLAARLSTLAAELGGGTQAGLGGADAPSGNTQPARESANESVSGRAPLPEPERFEKLDEFARAVLQAPEGCACAVLALDDAFSVAFAGGSCYICPLGGKTLLDAGATREDALKAIAPLLADGREKWICSEKRLRTELERMGLSLGGRVRDPALLAYVLDPQRKSFEAAALLEEAGLDPAFGASGLLALCEGYERQLEADGLESLLRDVEEPLSGVLYRMERRGFRANGDVLSELGRGYSERLTDLTREITALAGHEFNLQSPKQLAVVLYDEMGFSSGKKGANARSTNAETLEALSGESPIIDKILAYRKYAKLNGTYIEGLLKLLSAPGGDGRIHTRFDQTATATGRLSSAEPNLQNIPVRTELGRDIRRAFVAEEGWWLVDADYSQIELRVLAHMAGDERMIEAFCSGQDIHRRTASEVFGVPMEDVTGEMRSAAKAVNFGIVYGISDFGLAQNTGLTRARASEFIKTYLNRYPAIALYMRECVEKAKADGYVCTLLGRRRYIRELASANRVLRAFGERAAMNSPIQGTAADIIKLAMVAVDRALDKANMRSRLILQVHDELIVEAPEDEREAAAELLKREMESVMTLRAPLRAEVSVGRDWYACK